MVLVFLAWFSVAMAQGDESRFIQVEAKDKFARSELASLGMSIEFVRSDSVWGFADPETLRKINESHFVVRGGHKGVLDFPDEDARFHNYKEMQDELKALQTEFPDAARVVSIGESVKGRKILAIEISSDVNVFKVGEVTKPAALFMGAHHGREHLSVEIPLMLARYLLEHRNDPGIARLIDTRDIWIIPMVNPDGAEYDIASGKYRLWRKNRRWVSLFRWGVDLNRNYGFMWGSGGSSDNPASDVYMGPEPFSEPETRAIRDFVDSHQSISVLLTFHSFSELILYPWGYSYDKIMDPKDLNVFETMAQTMAQWNHYTPQQSSDLYITSGDTVDWAYGTHGIFAFTFELSPDSFWSGGFYPGAGIIERVFSDNLLPCLYLIGIADDPYKVVSSYSRSYVAPYVPIYSWPQVDTSRALLEN